MQSEASIRCDKIAPLNRIMRFRAIILAASLDWKSSRTPYSPSVRQTAQTIEKSKHWNIDGMYLRIYYFHSKISHDFQSYVSGSRGKSEFFNNHLSGKRASKRFFAISLAFFPTTWAYRFRKSVLDNLNWNTPSKRDKRLYQKTRPLRHGFFICIRISLQL